MGNFSRAYRRRGIVILVVNMVIKKRLEYPSQNETAGPPMDAALVQDHED
jgi:hypothetical protein